MTETGSLNVTVTEGTKYVNDLEGPAKRLCPAIEPALAALRDRVFSGPFERPLTWPFVPHVTLADHASPERIGAAIAAMGDYKTVVEFDALYVLQERADRRWEPIADARFEQPSIIGRGGSNPDDCTVPAGAEVMHSGG